VSTTVTSKPFGRLQDGQTAYLFTLTNSSGASVQITNFGAALVSAILPDKHGVLGPIALGFDTIDAYETNPAYVGVVIGPVANRISGGQFSLDGNTYTLMANEGETCLHSGAAGWHNKLWSVEPISQGLRLSYETKENAGGFPGTISAKIQITFDDDNRLSYSLRAKATAPTPIAMTRHEYFNLADGGASEIHDHIVQIHSTKFADQAKDQTSNGAVKISEGTVNALASPTPLTRFKMQDGLLPFDHHHIVDGTGLRPMARVQSPHSGRQLDVLGTADGIQFYTGQSMAVCKGRDGITYGPCHGFALEAQARPNAVNMSNFPSIILRPGSLYEDIIVYHFGLID